VDGAAEEHHPSGITAFANIREGPILPPEGKKQEGEPTNRNCLGGPWRGTCLKKKGRIAAGQMLPTLPEAKDSWRLNAVVGGDKRGLEEDLVPQTKRRKREDTSFPNHRRSTERGKGGTGAQSK